MYVLHNWSGSEVEWMVVERKKKSWRKTFAPEMWYLRSYKVHNKYYHIEDKRYMHLHIKYSLSIFTHDWHIHHIKSITHSRNLQWVETVCFIKTCWLSDELTMINELPSKPFSPIYLRLLYTFAYLYLINNRYNTENL